VRQLRATPLDFILQKIAPRFFARGGAAKKIVVGKKKSSVKF